MKTFLCHRIVKLGRFVDKNFLLQKITHLVSKKMSSGYIFVIGNFEKNGNRRGKVLGIR